MTHVRKHVFHGGRRTPLYWVWRSMLKRCTDPKSRGFKDYGGRGISVCPTWNDGFAAFQAWALASGYARGLQIDRINNDGNYEPKNCRWVTASENLLNTRANVNITAWGETKSATLWAIDKRCKVKRDVLYTRFKSGLWSPEDLISTPPDNANHSNRISRAQAEEIRKIGFSRPVRELAEQYGIHQNSIRNILGGHTWKL